MVINKDVPRREYFARYYKEHAEVYKMRARKWSKAHPEKEREKSRMQREQHPERRKRIERKSRLKDPEGRKKINRKASLKHFYNLTLEDYEEILRNQKNRCALCGELFKGKGYSVIDHDHKTGKV